MPDVSTHEMLLSTAGSGLKAHTEWTGQAPTDVQGPGARVAGPGPSREVCRMTFSGGKGNESARHQGWLLRCHGQVEAAPERVAGLPGPPPLRGPALERQRVTATRMTRGVCARGFTDTGHPSPLGPARPAGPEAPCWSHSPGERPAGSGPAVGPRGRYPGAVISTA